MAAGLADGEMADDAEEEGVGVAVVFQLVDVALANVAEVAHAQGGLAEGEVEGEEVAAAEGIEGMREADVVVVGAKGEQFVITLVVVGAEHETYEGKVELIAGGQGLAPQMEIVSGRC